MSPSFTEWQRKFRQRFPTRTKPVTGTSSAEPSDKTLLVDNHPTLVTSGHEYSTVNATGHANLHLGDVHYHSGHPSTGTKEQLMAALHFPEMFKRVENIQDPHSNTFKWILHPPERGSPQWSSFTDWVRQKGGLYWISGKPGSGKSVLTKYLAECAQQLWMEEEIQIPIILSFWFWEAAHNPLERNLFGCLRSLLWQLLHHPRYGDAICKAIGNRFTFEWTVKRLLDALNKALMHLARLRVPLLIFLDGLDECGDNGRDVLRFAISIVKQHDNLKMCVSSRLEPLFEITLSPYPHLRMQDLNEPDVYAIIDQDLLQTPEFGLVTEKEDQSQYLRHKIADMAQGVLLWVRLVTRDLLQGIVDGDTVLELRNRLTKMPSELEGEDGLYAFMLKRNAANSKSYLADAAFYLQLASHRSMSVIEFCLASNENLRASYTQLVDGWERLHFEIDGDRMARAVSARTAGLLEVVSRPAKLRWRAARTRCTVLTDILNDYNASRVAFIHRTARTYVFETSAGNQILAASTKSLDDIKQICFETWLIQEIVLESLESVAPVGLAKYPRGWPDCEHCFTPLPETYLSNVKHVIGCLERKSLLWTMSYQSLHWNPCALRFPCPKLNKHQVSFNLLFASLSFWGFVKFEISDVRVLDPSDVFYLFWSFHQGLKYHGVSRHFAEIAQELCNEILRYCPDPNFEVTSADGEQMPIFYPIALLHGRGVMLWKFEHLADPWLQQASISTRSRRCKPSMGQCNELFFEPQRKRKMVILSAFSYVDIAPLLALYAFEEEWFGQTSVVSATLDTPCVVLDWPAGAWRPKMYRLPSSDGAKILQNLPKQRIDAVRSDLEISCAIGMIEISGKVSPIFNLVTLTRASELRSLSEVFHVLGKTAEAIHSYVAAEDDRIRLAYDEVIYQNWRSWMYGADDSLLQQYSHVSRPTYLHYSLEDESL